MHLRVMYPVAAAASVLFTSACSGGTSQQPLPARPAGSPDGSIHIAQALQTQPSAPTPPQNQQVLIQTVQCTNADWTGYVCNYSGTSTRVTIQRYNLATAAALPAITVHTTGTPFGARSLFATADDSTFITPLRVATGSGSESEIDHTGGAYATSQHTFNSMSTDLTTLVALDASSSPNNASSIFDTFRTPFTTIFQRGTINRSGISPGLLNRDGSIAMGNVGQSAFSDDIGFTSIPGSNKTHVVQWSDPGNTCFQGPDAVDGNHAFYYFFLLGNGGCSYPRTIPDEIGIMNFHTFTYAGYINLPNNHRNALDVSQINGDLYVPVGSNIYVWNIAACGCARVQRELPGYFSDAVPVADRSGQHLILYGHPASNANEMDVISVNAQTGALEHTYYKGLSASGDHTYVTSALAQ